MRCLILLVLLFGSLAPAAAEVSYTPEPGWLSEAEVPPGSEGTLPDASGGVHYRYFGRQVRVDPNGEPSYYYRYVIEITNQSGLEDQSQINISFDPVYERIQLHRLNVIRDGQVIDQLRSTPLRMLDQESDLDQQLYNGTRTANLLLGDLRVGDLLDYSYSYLGDNPIFDGVFDSRFKLQWGVPIDRTELRILWQKEHPLTVGLLNSDWEFEHHRVAAGDEYRLRIDDLESLALEDDTPDWFDPYPTAFFVEQTDWREVVDWGRGLFHRSTTTSDSIRNVAAEIRERTSNVPEQVAATLQFVQDKIRYVGIEIGVNSHQASPAPLVLSRRYGDCKDKTSLMITILRELGIDAFPALVNTVAENRIETRPPSMRSFNHVLVALPLDGKTYWLDPTRNHQKGGLEQIYQPDYGLALVLREDEDKLTSMEGPARNSGYEVFEQFDFEPGENESVRFSVTTEYFGANAEWMIAKFQRDSLSEITQEYLDWYQNFYPQISSLHEPRISTGEDGHRFRVEETYRIENFWESQPEEGRDLAWVYSTSTNTYLKQPDKISRTQVYDMGKPISIRHGIRLNLEDLDWSFEDFAFEEDNDFFRYRVSEKYDPASKVMLLDYVYANKTDHVVAADFPDYLAALERADEQTDFGFYRYYDSLDAGADSDVELDYESIAILGAFAAIILFIVFSIIQWRYDVARHPFGGEMIYYPIEPAKFVFLWIFTLGFFPIYWFYRLWRYDKTRFEDSRTMPFFRGVFFVLWFYPAYEAVSRYLRDKGLSGKIPRKLEFVVLALLLLAVSVISVFYEELWIPATLVSPFLVLPLLWMVNLANRQNSEARKHNSRWALRHYLLVPICLPLYIFSAGSELGYFPAEGVVKGESLFGHHIKFMQRNGIIDPGEQIVYFYSDALWNLRDDGNGFSRQQVFSYWRGDNDELEIEKVDFDEIEDVQVYWSEAWHENTTVEVIRKDGGKVVLYLSNTDRLDRVFVEELMSRWKETSR